MASFFDSGVFSDVLGSGIDFDRREKSEPTAVKDGELSDFECVRTEFEEIVPDSDDEVIGKRGKLRKGTVVGSELIGLRNGRPFVDCLAAEGEEEYGIVPDSEEDSDGGKQRVLNEHGGFPKRRLECLNVSQRQEPEESSQVDALRFVDHFLKCNVLDMSSDGKSRSFVKPRSPPKSCVKGVTTLARKISNRTPAVEYISYDWIDSKPNKVSALCRNSDMLFYSRRRKRCASIKSVIATVKSVDDNLHSISNSQQENEEVTNLSNEITDEAQTGKTLISGSDEVEFLGNTPERITGESGKDSNVVTNTKLQNSGVDEESGNEPFDDVFNTQMAAEVMETLLFEPPKKWNTHLLSNGCQTVITDTKEKVERVGYSSHPNRSYSGLEVNGDRLKHTKRIKGESGSQKRGSHKNDRPVITHFSTGKEDRVCDGIHNSEKLYFKTATDRMGSEEASECSDKFHEEPHLVSLDCNACSGLLKNDFETKISNLVSPMRRLSEEQQISEQKATACLNNLVYTYKRRQSAMVRKENKRSIVMLDMAEVESNIESRKEHKGLSNVKSGRNALNSLVFPKGKRTRRGSRNLKKNSDSIGNVRSEADTEQEVKCPSAKRHKPTNHLAEPVWAKFQRKMRTSATFNKHVNILDSFKVEASKRSKSDFNDLKSCVGGAGKNDIFDDSSVFHGSNSLTSISNNGGTIPLVSSLNSAHFENLPGKMPKSSLIRELIELGEFSDIPLYSSCKNLRRRKHVANVRVLLSQHLDNDTTMQQKEVLARFGISIATKASDATHFVTNMFSRTKNMLEAIALGIPIVTQLWLESSAEAGFLVDEKIYILKDSRKEKEIGFSMSSSLAKASRSPLLKDHKVFITPNIKPDKGMLSGLVKMVQGEVVGLTKNDRIPEDVIVLSCEEDYPICTPFLAKGIPVYHPELLLNGIVTQKLDIQRHHLFRDRVKGLPHMLKDRTR